MSGDAPDQRLLRAALLSNAAFSAVCGVSIVLVDDRLARELGGLPPWILWVLGISLIGFAGLVLRVSRSRPIDGTWAAGISTADGLWVAGSLALLGAGPVTLTPLGSALVAAVAVVVLAFGSLQVAGLLRSQGQPQSQTIEHTHDAVE